MADAKITNVPDGWRINNVDYLGSPRVVELSQHPIYLGNIANMKKARLEAIAGGEYTSADSKLHHAVFTALARAEGTPNYDAVKGFLNSMAGGKHPIKDNTGRTVGEAGFPVTTSTTITFNDYKEAVLSPNRMLPFEGTAKVSLRNTRGPVRASPISESRLYDCASDGSLYGALFGVENPDEIQAVYATLFDRPVAICNEFSRDSLPEERQVAFGFDWGRLAQKGKYLLAGAFLHPDHAGPSLGFKVLE